MKRSILLGLFFLSFLFMLDVTDMVFAQPSSSSNYQVNESFIGPGGLIDSSSANYSGNESIGGTAVGEGGSASYQTQDGANTTSDPRLEFSVGTSTINFSTVSSTTTATTTATFSVLNYSSSGYVVTINGSPPSNGSHTLTAMSTSGASSVGTEQFGLNLVANTLPTVFGANPVQVPDSSFSNGIAASGYDTANTFRYVDGETIASAAASSGQTNYTVSYILNAAIDTPAGSYIGTQNFICTGTF